jgi:hypothetical protein
VTTFDRTDAVEVFGHDNPVGLSYGSVEPDDPMIGWQPIWQALGFATNSDSETKSITRFRHSLRRAAEPLGKMTRRRTTVTFPHWFAWLVLLVAGWPSVRSAIRFATRKTRNSGGKKPSQVVSR